MAKPIDGNAQVQSGALLDAAIGAYINATATALPVAQASHGFTVGNAIYWTGSAWAKAQSNAISTLGVAMVSAVADSGHFTAMFSGYITGIPTSELSPSASLTAGQYYFVSDVVAGDITATEPTSTTSYSNPIFFALTTNSGLVLQFRPDVVSTSLVIPHSMAKITNNWLDSYDSSTGLFTQSQPSFESLSDVVITSVVPAQIPQWDGSHWVNVSLGAATAPAGTTVVTTNDSYTAGQRRTYDLTMAKIFTAWRVTEATGKKFRLQLYETSTDRSNDSSRGFTIPLKLGQPHGCFLDLYIPQTAVWVTPFKLSPPVLGSNNDGPPQLTTIYAAVTSVETGTQNISVTISFVPMES